MDSEDYYYETEEEEEDFLDENDEDESSEEEDRNKKMGKDGSDDKLIDMENVVVPKNADARSFLIGIINHNEKYHINEKELKKYRNNENLDNPCQAYSGRSLKTLIKGFENKNDRTKFQLEKFDLQRDFRWNMEYKTQLIDSIIQGFNVGQIVLWEVYHEDKTTEFQLVDGLQRITTLSQFRNNELRWRGCTYSELSIQDKHHFDDYQVPCLDLRNYSYGMARHVFQRIQNSISLSPGELAYASDHIPIVHYIKSSCQAYPRFVEMFENNVSRTGQRKCIEIACRIIAHQLSGDLSTIKDLESSLTCLRSINQVNAKTKTAIRDILKKITNMFQLQPPLPSGRNMPQKITSTDLLLINFMIVKYGITFSNYRAFGNFYRNIFGSRKRREIILIKSDAALWQNAIRGTPTQPLAMEARLCILLKHIRRHFKKENSVYVPINENHPIFQLSNNKKRRLSNEPLAISKRSRNSIH